VHSIFGALFFILKNGFGFLRGDYKLHKILETIMNLQDIDTQLQKLELGKGDLPAKVKAFSGEVERTREILSQKKANHAANLAEQASVDLQVTLVKDRLNKYKVQQYQVKNNKEYDAITTEIETALKNKDDLEYRIEELKEMIALAEKEIEHTEAHLKELEESLTSLRAELEKKLAITHEEEKALIAKRQTVVPLVPKPILSTYERIRQGRGGYAVAMLQQGACSQCSSRVPPQRGLEIRMMNKINLCEVCGRILVWKPEEIESSPVE
jgi:uncharacterized protein